MKTLILFFLFIIGIQAQQKIEPVDCDCSIRQATYSNDYGYKSGLVTIYTDQYIFSFADMEPIVFKHVDNTLYINDQLEFIEIKNHLNLYIFKGENETIFFIY